MTKCYEVLNKFTVKTQELHRAIFDKGYEQGYNEGHAHQLASDHVFRESCVKSAYKKGLNDAWECIKKLVFDKNDGGLTFTEIAEIFDGERLSAEILESYSASEAIAKIKEYEEKQNQADNEIKVGDEVVDGKVFNSGKGIVTFVSPYQSPVILYILW